MIRPGAACSGPPVPPSPPCSWAAREPTELRIPVLLEGITTLLTLFAHVEEHGGVSGELLKTGQAVVGGVEPALDHPQGNGRQGQHAPTPGDRFAFEGVQGHHLVDKSPVCLLYTSDDADE